MKLLTAIIRPFKLDDVREALMHFHSPSLTTSEVQGFGLQKRADISFSGAESSNGISKLKVEIAVNDDVFPLVLEAIQTAARTGKTGDGMIVVIDLAQAVRIRTGESDDDAL